MISQKELLELMDEVTVIQNDGRFNKLQADSVIDAHRAVLEEKAKVEAKIAWEQFWEG